MRQFIDKINNHENLTSSEIEEAFVQIMSGNAPKEEVAAFLLDLREKGVTVDEITGAAKVMRKFVIPVKSNHKIIFDTCGTGGDKQNTFNISTLVAFVVAGAGIAVAKHGNRSVSSKCGSADILEALGVKIDLESAQMEDCLNKNGIVFLFAQKLHPAMKNVAAIRKELGVETIFNILGPLTNPAKATHQIMGVYSRDYVEPLANVLKNLKLKRALVVHGADGLDEITTTDKTFMSEFNGKEIISYSISPEELNFSIAKREDLTGGDLKKNLDIFERVLKGEKGPKRDIVLLNAAFSIYIAQKTKTINDALVLAADSLDSGKALAKLEALKNFQ